MLLGNLLNGLPHLVVVFLASDDGFCVFPCFLHLVVDLQDGDIVGLAHEESDGFEECVIQFLDTRVSAHNFRHQQCRLELRLDICTEVHILQPHHSAEVALDFLGASVMSAWAEQRIAISHILIVQEVRIAVYGIHNLVDFFFYHSLVLIAHGRCAFPCDKRLSNGEIGLVETTCRLHLLAHGRGEVLVELGGKQVDNRVELLFLYATQYVVEIEVIELQIEVGCDKRGEVAVIVLLVDVEELNLLSRHDGESILAQRTFQSWVECGELVRIQNIVNIHPLSAFRTEIQFA